LIDTFFDDRFAMGDALVHVTTTADGKRPQADEHKKMFLTLSSAIDTFIEGALGSLADFTNSAPYAPEADSSTVEDALASDNAQARSADEEREYVDLLAERINGMSATAPASIIRQNALRAFWAEMFGDQQVGHLDMNAIIIHSVIVLYFN
jgi:hypothetical protein